MKQTSDGGFVLAGYTSSFGEGGDFWLVKMGENGDSLWSRTFGGQRHDCCYSVQQSLDGGYALAGGTQSFGASESDFWLVKIGPELAAEPISFSLPSQYALHPNWPNPFNPYTRISYDLPKRGYVTLTIFDLLGREVATIVHSMQAAGNHTTIFDGSRLPSGIYFCRIQADDFVDAKKMVLLK
ncbi:MAG: T9SS type A sorting domain-containing protein [Calditrichaeota bacterium]|nr:T9SS type A sorting domain-containing protein [Calditrichota bacterium]